MKPISTDFTLTMPSELSPLSASSSCTFTIKVYTVNRQNHYSMSFSGVPATVRVASQSMMSMDTGVVNFDWFVSEVDPSMPDGTYDTEGNCTSDFFWVKRPTDDLLDSLTERVSNAENEASAAFEYASSAYTFADEALDLANSALSAASAASDELDSFEGEMYTALATKHDTTAFTAFVENSAVTKGNFEDTLTHTRSWEKLRDEVGTKQDTLIAGSGISIENNVISVTPTSGYVTTEEFDNFVDNSAVTKGNFDTVLEASQGWGAMQSEVSGNSTDISTLSGQVSANTSNIATVSGNVNTLSGDVQTLSGTVTGYSSDISTLSGQVSANSTDINTLSGQVTANTSNIATISGAVTGKQDTLIAGTGISIDNNVISVTGGTPSSGYVTTEELEESELVTAAALNDLNTRVNDVSASTSAITALSADVQTLSGQVSANTSNIATLSGTVTGYSSDISTLSGNVNTLSGQVSTNTSGISTLSGTVSGNSSDISTISGQVTANTSDITSLSGQIGDIATALSAIVGE